MRKILLIVISIILATGFVYFFNNFFQVETTKAAAQPVIGWAWLGANCTDETTCSATTNPIGWISFSSNNPEITCEIVSYGVNVDYSTGEISGAAWVGVGEDAIITDCNVTEKTVGWLYFDYTGTDWPSGVSPSYDFAAKMVGNEIQGWAPIVSKDSADNQTIVTWVRFKGSNYSIKINNDGTIGTSPLNSSVDHYAWSNKGSEGGLGWIDFSPVNGGVIFPPLNQPPSASNLQVTQPDYCLIGWASAIFSWTFTDPDDSQSAYRIQIDTDSNFLPPYVVDTDKTPCAPPCSFATQSGQLSFNNTYYWRVKVWDSKDLSSVWIYPPSPPGSPTPSPGTSFTTPLHAYPDVARIDTPFTWSPLNPAVNESTQFADQSTVYGGAVKSAWSWTFQDGNPATSVLQNPLIKFLSAGAKSVTLKVTDSDGFACTGQKTVNTLLKLPDWIEIPPF